MLDKTQFKIMRIISKNQFITDDALRAYFAKPAQSIEYLKAVDYLGINGYIRRGKSDKDEVVYDLSAKGSGEYLQQHRSNVEFRLTQIFALIGAITGVAGTIIGIIALKY